MVVDDKIPVSAGIGQPLYLLVKVQVEEILLFFVHFQELVLRDLNHRHLKVTVVDPADPQKIQLGVNIGDRIAVKQVQQKFFHQSGFVESEERRVGKECRSWW